MIQKLLPFAVVLMMLGLGGCQFSPLATSDVVSLPTTVADPTPLPVLEFSFEASESGITALDVTKTNATVELKQYDFGAMVVSINDYKADNAHFWGLYVNDKLADMAADKMVVNKNDRVRWKYETIK